MFFNRENRSYYFYHFFFFVFIEIYLLKMTTYLGTFIKKNPLNNFKPFIYTEKNIIFLKRENLNYNFF